MPNYKLVFSERSNAPVRSIAFSGTDAAEVFLLAQRYEGPAELWVEEQHVCTLARSGNSGEVWVLSGHRAEVERPRQPETDAIG
jgi:hypothetical protein